MRENVKKRGTLLNFLYISTYRFRQKGEHMVNSLIFLLQNEGCPSKRGTVAVDKVCKVYVSRSLRALHLAAKFACTIFKSLACRNISYV